MLARKRKIRSLLRRGRRARRLDVVAVELLRRLRLCLLHWLVRHNDIQNVALAFVDACDDAAQ